MTVSGVGSSSSLLVQSLVDMRARLDDLQRQLATGKKSDTYAGLGLDRGLTVGLRSQLSAIAGYDDTVTNVGVRFDLAQTALGQIGSVGQSVKTAMRSTLSVAFDANGQTLGQQSAMTQLDQIVGLLNTQAGDRFLFSGRAVDQPAAASTDLILNGSGTQAGFKQIVSERNQADMGASGLGRLVIPAAVGTNVSIGEDTAGSPFGFKLAGASTTIAGAAVTGPAGSPPSIAVNLGATNPNAGNTIKLTFNLPDGTTQDLTLKATASATPGPDEFTIGATPAATAANLQATLTASVGKLARTSLSAASAIAASNDFFSTDAANPPRRVAGPPFATATALVAGTPSNTVSWYTGEAGSDLARSTAAARVDQSLVVGYGVRANEEALRSTVANVALFATMTFSPSDPDAQARYTALTQKLSASLDGPAGTQTVADITNELASAQVTMNAAKDRHLQTSATLQDLLDQVQNVPPEQAAAQILALQTSLQASMQTTAKLFQLSLVNFL